MSREEQKSWVQLAGIMTGIPVILGSGPLVGWWVGQWVDRRFRTEPLGLITGLLLGVAASVSQTGRLLRFFTKDKATRRASQRERS